MIFGSLFSGIGGMDLGLERAGMSVLFQCEKDEYRREVLNERFPGTKIFEDVSEVHCGKSEGRDSAHRFYSESGEGRREAWTGVSSGIDLLCGGFPCQDLSVAGKRAGLAGERSGLFFEFARIADESIREGGFVLIENVPGLFSSNEGKDFEIILKTLSEFGFNDCSWRTLNSQYFGVPQRRRRVFILARRTRGSSCAEILLEPESSSGNYSENTKTWEKDSIVALTGLGSGGPDDNDAQNGRLVEQLISGPITSRHGKGPNTTLDDGAIIPFQIYPESGQGADLVMKETEIAPAVTSINEGHHDRGLRIAHEVGVRRLTPIECERLQGLPDNWTLVNDASDTKRYAAIGDAVTVPVAEWIGRRILKHAW